MLAGFIFDCVIFSLLKIMRQWECVFGGGREGGESNIAHELTSISSHNCV